MGHPLDWHVRRLKEYFSKHPEINLNKLEDFYYIDNNTNPASTIQGLLCQIVYKKDGVAGLKRLMTTYTSMNEVLEKEFKLDINKLNEQLRELIGQQ